ncbi:MAG: hypothetical protein ACOCXH_05655, partial [Cyclobacteriaceae bacterium]
MFKSIAFSLLVFYIFPLNAQDLLFSQKMRVNVYDDDGLMTYPVVNSDNSFALLVLNEQKIKGWKFDSEQ